MTWATSGKFSNCAARANTIQTWEAGGVITRSIPDPDTAAGSLLRNRPREQFGWLAPLGRVSFYEQAYRRPGTASAPMKPSFHQSDLMVTGAEMGNVDAR